MAIDGVKIIDSDDGHDIYNLIVERYRDGTSIDTIVSEILAEEQNFCTDEFYTEIYWTAVAYSLWKIGHAKLFTIFIGFRDGYSSLLRLENS